MWQASSAHRQHPPPVCHSGALGLAKINNIAKTTCRSAENTIGVQDTRTELVHGVSPSLSLNILPQRICVRIASVSLWSRSKQLFALCFSHLVGHRRRQE